MREVRHCRKCGKLTERYETHSACVECAKARAKAQRERQVPEYVRAYHAEYVKTHAPQVRENKRRYAERNAEAIRAARRDMYQKNPEKFAAKRDALRGCPASRAKHTLTRLRAKSAREGLPAPDLTHEDCDRSTAHGHACPVLPHIVMICDVHDRGGAYPELDRIIPHKGYVRGNVRFISSRANNLKNNATKAEIAALYADSLTWPDD